MIVKAAILWLTTVSDTSLASETDIILAALEGNLNFPTPQPTAAAIAAALAEFRVAMNDAAGGGKHQMAVKRAKRAALVALLRQLASYLTVASNEDMVKLLSSKFPYQKPVRNKIGALPTPEAPYLALGKYSGELDASVTAIYGAYTYVWRVALQSAPETYVQTVQTTASRATIKGLTPGQIYLVDVSAIGAAGATDWSDAMPLMVV